MSTFECSFCEPNRKFQNFTKYFRHLTVFHQNEANFRMVCNLNLECGVLYKTYAAYKSHIYRHHFNLLNMNDENTNNIHDINSTASNRQSQEDLVDNHTSLDKENKNCSNLDDNYESNLFYDATAMNLDESYEDTDSINQSETVDLSFKEKNEFISLEDIKKAFTSFLLQLREEFLLPNTTTDVISNYIVNMLINLKSIILQKLIIYDESDRCNSSGHATNDLRKIPKELKIVEDIIDDICKVVDRIGKTNHTFLQHCKEYFKYDAPEEIIISDDGQALEQGYYIPFDQIITSIFRYPQILEQTFENIKQQQLKTNEDNDLMFSYRHGNYGSRVDDESLLIQLYADEIGVTNPIGARKDRHKLLMIYFCIEDLPDQFRSQLDHIHLVGICEARILKVKVLKFIALMIVYLK